MIVLLNASTNSLTTGCKHLMPHSKSGTCRRTDRTIDLQIGDHCHDDPSGDTKLMDDMMFNEVDHVVVLTSTSRTVSANFEK